MTDNREEKSDIVNVKETDNVDSDKSFESCVNSVVDGISNVLIKDDDSERSFQSCSNINQDKMEYSESKNSNNVEDDEDDDIRPGSCRENPSSDDETSSWDENKDNWIYDAEYVKEAESKTQLPEAEITEHDLQSCKEDLNYIIENHVSKDIKHEIQFNEINNPTFIPTNGKFYMHDLRLDDPIDEGKKTSKVEKNVQNKSNENWKHDLYNEVKQKPISKGELINKYGTDIRKKNDIQEIKENKARKSYRANNNFKRYNYRRNYDYEYYDSYDSYDYGYYYSGDGYYDYNYYEPQYNSWNRPYRESNRNHPRYEYRNYKSNSPEVKSKKVSSRPPSKYSQISEYTDIKITVNRDNLGTRQIESVSNNNNNNNSNSNRNHNSRVFENSNFRRVDERFNAEESEGNVDFVEPCDHSTPRRDQGDSESASRNLKGAHKPANNLTNPRKTGNIPVKRNNNYPPPAPPGSSHRNYVENNASQQRNSGKTAQHKFSEPSYSSEHERTQGRSQLGGYRYKQQQFVPDWANTKYEWDPNCDFKDVIEEMPPLTEKEINQLQKRSMNCHNPPPPRFSREKSAPQFFDSNNKTNQNSRAQTFVPKRYSELRNQSEPPQQTSSPQQPRAEPTQPQPPPPPQPQSTATNQQHQIINYQQIMPSLEYYNNLQPLLLNMQQNQHPNSAAPANSPQQSSNAFPSMHHHHHPHPHAPPSAHMVSLSSLIQPANTGAAYDNTNQPIYIHPFYLPNPAAAAATVTRLNQFSQPFQPSYVSQTSSQTPAYPTASSASSSSSTVNTPNNNVSQNSRAVLGRS